MTRSDSQLQTLLLPADSPHHSAGKKPISPPLQALLIDIDDTIVRARTTRGLNEDGQFHTGSLMDVLRSAGVALGGLTSVEADRRIDAVCQQNRWWHWSDFIVELDLNPKAFWQYAYEVERQYIEPTGDDILPALNRLKAAGILLYVTSNNPSSGILHKLRLAGLGNVQGSSLFSQLLGSTELHAKKASQIYWKKALAHIGLEGRDTAVVGDNLCDDYLMPQSAGVRCSFIIDRQSDRTDSSDDRLIHVRNFEDIANLILKKTRHVSRPVIDANPAFHQSTNRCEKSSPENAAGKR